MNILGNEQEMHSSKNYVTSKQVNRNKWKPVTSVPAMLFAKVGAAVMLNRKRLVNRPFLFDNNTMCYSFGECWNADFGKITFETIDLTALVQVGALPSYNTADVENLEVCIPKYNSEQQQIGTLFRRLDSLITLQQRKLENPYSFLPIQENCQKYNSFTILLTWQRLICCMMPLTISGS
ncbi:restriction endonuclease subunit S [Arcanobacterium hippocoleae]